MPTETKEPTGSLYSTDEHKERLEEPLTGKANWFPYSLNIVRELLGMAVNITMIDRKTDVYNLRLLLVVEWPHSLSDMSEARPLVHPIARLNLCNF